MARGRRLLRSTRRLVPAAIVVLVVSLAAVIAIGLLPELRRRREGPVARLARRTTGLSSRLPTFDA